MKFEIAVDGPLAAISRLHARLGSSSPDFETLPKQNRNEEGRGRILFSEGGRDEVDARLQILSKIITDLEKNPFSGQCLEMRVRNLAYSEPVTGGSDFKRPFKPIPSLTIQPWDPTVRYKQDANRIVIEPQYAFGTGKHPTTRLCLKAIKQIACGGTFSQGLSGRTVLDFGCGTGLLAMAAAKMGARKVVGVDIDSDSVEAARHNIWLNRLSSRTRIRNGSWDVLHEQFDLILANLVASVLLRTGLQIPAHLREQGVAVISGFGNNQAVEMERSLGETGLDVIRRYDLKGWVAFTMAKRGRE